MKRLNTRFSVNYLLKLKPEKKISMQQSCNSKHCSTLLKFFITFYIKGFVN